MKKKVLLSALLGAVAFGSIGLFAACGSDDVAPTTTPTPSYKDNTSVTDVADVEYTYDADGDVTSWTQGAKLYTAKYLLKGDSASYVELAGAKPEELEIVGYHGAIDTLSVKDIENAVTVDGKAISVSGIKTSAFYGCSTLKSVDLSKKNRSLNFNIGANAFYNCTALTEFKFPEEVYSVGNSIGDYAFAGCAALTSITVPANFNNIGAGAFANCVELKSVTLPDTVEVISEKMFSMDDHLESFSGARNAKSIQSNAFYGTALTGFNFDNYSKLTYIGDNAFRNTLLTEVVVPQSVGYIGKQAFYNLESLTKVEVPFLGYSVNNAYSWTFEENYGLSGLKETEKDEREIAVSVTAAVQIGDSAFAGLESVKSITITNFIAEGRYDVYDDKGLVKNRVEVEPNYVIGDGAFKNCHNLSALSLPQGVIAIGENAFLNCYNMESIAMQSGLESIGNNALKNCRKLTKIELPDTVKEIGDSAFYGCRELTEMTFPASVTKLGTAVLGDCASLKSISIKKAWSVNSEEQESGSVDYYENQLTIGRNLFAITTPSEFINSDEMYKTSENDFYAYNIPASLTSITIDGVKDIPENAFSGMKNLTNIKLSFITEKDVPNNYKTYYNRKYGMAYKLTTNIGDNAFYDCRKLTAVTVPATATSIGDNAFYGCREITSFTLPESVTSIGSAILGDCIKLKTLTVEKWDGLKQTKKDEGYYTYYSNEYYTIGSLNKLFSSSSTYWTEERKEFTGSEDYEYDNENFNNRLAVYQASGYYSSNDSNVYLPKSLTSVVVDSVCQVPQYAFNGWSYLQSVDLTFVRGYRSESYMGAGRYSHTPIVGSYAFYNCAALSEIETTEGKEVKTINDHAFEGCGSAIGNVFTAFPAVEYIGQFALAYSSYNGTLTLPSSLTYIGKDLLAGCESLTGLVIDDYSKSYGQNEDNYSYNGAVRNLFGDDYEIDYGEYGFHDYKYKLTTVTLNGVETFAVGAMQGMCTVRTLTINGNVDGLNNSLFSEMTSLQKLNFTLPAEAYTNYIGIMSGCESLTELSVQLPTDSAYLNSAANLSRLYGYNKSLPASLTKINLVTGTGNNYIPVNFLYGASYVAEVTFTGRRLSGIGSSAFYGCGVCNESNLKELKDPDTDEVVADSYVINGWVIGSGNNSNLYIPQGAYGVASGILPTSYSYVYYEDIAANWENFLTKSNLSWSYTNRLYVYQNNEWSLYNN